MDVFGWVLYVVGCLVEFWLFIECVLLVGICDFCFDLYVGFVFESFEEVLGEFWFRWVKEICYVFFLFE